MTTLVLTLSCALPGATLRADELVSGARRALEEGDKKRAAGMALLAIKTASVRPGEFLAVHRGAQDVMLACGRAEELVGLYDALLRQDFGDPARRYLRARLEPDLNRRRRDLEAVAAAEPDFFWAVYDLAGTFAGLGRWARASEAAERAAGLAPKDGDVWNVLGHLRLEASRFLDEPSDRKAAAEKAIEAFDRALRLDASHHQARHNKGLALFALGRPEEARLEFEEALKTRPSFPEALVALGHLRARSGDLDGAVELYRKAIETDPSSGTAHNNLAVAYFRKKKLQLARASLARAEARGHRPDTSFKRSLVRAIEQEAFMRFLEEVASATKRKVNLLCDNRQLRLSKLEGMELVSGVLKARFRDSRGGVRLGPRRAGGVLVCEYVEAARVVLTLWPGGERTLVMVRRDLPDGSRGRLAGWVAETGFQFSAEAPELVEVVGGILAGQKGGR